MKRLWQRWLGLILLLLLHLSHSDARTQPLKHRRANSVAAKSEQGTRSVRQPVVAGRDTGAGFLAEACSPHWPSLSLPTRLSNECMHRLFLVPIEEGWREREVWNWLRQVPKGCEEPVT